MTFRAKFNLVMLVAFLVGLGLAGIFVNTVSERGAKRAVLAEAAAVMGAGDATIHYTDQQVSPLLNRQMKAQFLPQSIPFYAAQQTFQLMASAFPDYAFRQPTTNPTNPADRPVPWEADIIKKLVEQPNLDQLVVERTTSTGKVLSYARPVRVNSDTCLACHSTPEAAPASMVDIYGRENGFGWKVGDTVGAQISISSAFPWRVRDRTSISSWVG